MVAFTASGADIEEAAIHRVTLRVESCVMLCSGKRYETGTEAVKEITFKTMFVLYCRPFIASFAYIG